MRRNKEVRYGETLTVRFNALVKSAAFAFFSPLLRVFQARDVSGRRHYVRVQR